MFLSYVGVLAGLEYEWDSMVFFFFLLVFIVHGHIGFMLEKKIDTCFEQLQNIITKKSDSARLEKLKTGRKLDLFMIFFTGGILLLSILARQRPLMLCIILVTVTIANYISRGLVFMLRIKAYFKRIEELICKTTDDAGSKKLLAE
ncbi:MAG: hypothetical protein ACYS3S_22900 [Planctomycetota bacterium]